MAKREKPDYIGQLIAGDACYRLQYDLPSGVVVSRSNVGRPWIIYRDGESVYMVNGHRARTFSDLGHALRAALAYVKELEE